MKLTSHKLLFKNPTFSTDPERTQITVRHGIKWSRRLTPGMTVTVAETDGFDLGEARIVGVLYTSFDELPASILHLEHDPECRTRGGLLTVLRRMYPGFVNTDMITVLFFKYEKKP